MNLFDDTLARIATVARATQPALMRMRFSCKRERRYWTGFLSVTSNRRSNGKGVKSNLLHAAAAATWFYFDLLRDRAAGRTASDFKGDPSKKKSIFFSSSFFSLPPSKPQSRRVLFDAVVMDRKLIPVRQRVHDSQQVDGIRKRQSRNTHLGSAIPKTASLYSTLLNNEIDTFDF